MCVSVYICICVCVCVCAYYLNFEQYIFFAICVGFFLRLLIELFDSIVLMIQFSFFLLHFGFEFNDDAMYDFVHRRILF